MSLANFCFCSRVVGVSTRLYQLSPKRSTCSWCSWAGFLPVFGGDLSGQQVQESGRPCRWSTRVPSLRRKDMPELSSPPKRDLALEQRVHEPLEAHRHLDELARRWRRPRGRSGRKTPGSCRWPASSGQSGTVAAEQVLHGTRRCSGSGSSRPSSGMTMPWRSASGSVPPTRSYLSSSARCRGNRRRAFIAYGERAIHADLAIMVDGHEAARSGRPAGRTTSMVQAVTSRS